jgi:hypothetical protein
MPRPRPTPATAKPWVEWCANHIEDPVTRLRFLQSVKPLTEANSRRPLWWFGAGAFILLAIAATLFLARASARTNIPVTVTRPVNIPPTPAPPATTPLPPVWLVDKSAESETYSNGLRVDTRAESPTRPRGYLAFPANRPDESAGVRRTTPAGIVFHTTESLQLPFEARANGALKQVGESLIDFVRRRHAYNYLIDRFGRVYRIVPEGQVAEHAGYSVWSDTDWMYVNLNSSFLGVSFEARTEPGQEDPTVSPAQVHSAAMLSDMLRSRYGISAGNCVTHAQVSVNAENMRVGYHTDWASSFPFAQLGLPDNYARPLPAIALFGFEYDATFVHWAGTRLYAGVELAEADIARGGGASFRKMLQKRYRARLAEAMGGSEASTEGDGR